MSPRRLFRPSPIAPLEVRTAPSHLGHPAAHHVAVHHAVKVHVAATPAVGAANGPVVGGTIGTGAGATLNPTTTYLLPVSAYGSGVAGNPYGGLSNSATINNLDGGTATLPGAGPGTAANGLIGPGLASSATLGTPLDGAATIAVGSGLSGFVVGR